MIQEFDPYLLKSNLIGNGLSVPNKGLVLEARAETSFDQLDDFTKLRAQTINQIMDFLIMIRSINPHNLEGAVLDFGMGIGPGAYVLQQYGGYVTGVDSAFYSVQRTIDQGILPIGKAYFKDGFEYLRSLQPDSLNLIAAFKMHKRFPHKRLYLESRRVLKPKGQLLITGELVELKEELQRTVGKYGKVENLVTNGDTTLKEVAFIYTKR